MSLDTNALMRAARCFDCLPSSTQEEIVTYIIAFATGLGSDPDHLAQLAKCMKCLSPATLREVRSYLLARLAGGSTDPNVLSEEAKCYVCIPDGMLGAVETYLFSTDPAGPGISDPNALAFAARFFQKLNSPTLLEIQVYALATAAGTGTDPNTLASLAKCFTCLPLPFLRNAGVFLAASVEPIGGGPGVSGCTDVAATLIPVITANYTAGVVTSLNVVFPKVCCTPLGWIAVQGDLADLSDGTSIGGGLDTVGHGGETNFPVTVGITGGFFTPITKTYVGVIQQCAGGVNSAVSNAVTAIDGLTPATQWADRVQINGGARPSQPTINAAATFMASIIGAGISSKMIALNFFAPDNLIAAITPLIVGPGLDPWTNTLFVAGDLTVNGLIGDANIIGAGTKQLDTGLNPQTCFANNTSAGLTVYCHSAPFNQSITGELGVENAGFTSAFCLRAEQNNVNMFAAWDLTSAPQAGWLNYSSTGIFGFLSGSRTGAAAGGFYFANSTHPFALKQAFTGTSGVRPNVAKTIHCHHVFQDGAAGQYTAKRISFAAVHLGLTSVETQALFNAVQQLRQSLGGGFV